MRDGSAIDLLDLLQSRFGIVEAVERGPIQKPNLEDEVDVSRSTIDRAIKDLETAGIVTRSTGGYELTLYGRLLTDHYREYLDRTRQLVRSGPLLDALPAEAPMSLDFLLEASVYRPTPPAPHRPVRQFEELAQRGNTLYGLSRTISQSSTARVLEEEVRNGRLKCELVVSADLAAYLAETRSDAERAMVETGRYRAFEVESLPYGLAIFDLGTDAARAILFVYGSSNELLGTVVNDTPPAIEWATSVYERYRADAAELFDETRSE